MSGVNNVNQANNVAYLSGVGGDPNMVSLSPEMLLAYCSSRLETLDTTIQTYFAEQQQRNRDMRTLMKLQELLRESTWKEGQLGSEEIKDNPAHLQNHANKGNEILELYMSTDSPEVKAECAKAFFRVTGLNINDYRGGRKVTADDVNASAKEGRIPHLDSEKIAAELESIKDAQSAISKGAELSMIQLQSLVSQRQLAIQLTTQLMQTLNESSKQVVGNIR